MRDRIHRACRANDCRQDLFDEIEAELISLINSNNMDTFTSTPAFKFCCLLLNHPTYRFMRRAPSTGASAGEMKSSNGDSATGGVSINHSGTRKEVYEDVDRDPVHNATLFALSSLTLSLSLFCVCTCV